MGSLTLIKPDAADDTEIFQIEGATISAEMFPYGPECRLAEAAYCRHGASGRQGID